MEVKREPDFVTKPTLFIEWVIAVVILLGGIYIISPFFQPTPGVGSSALRDTLTTKVSLYTFGTIYSLMGVGLSFGIITGSRVWRRWSLFSIFLIILFTVILGWLINGLRPITWLSSLGIGIISGIIWLQIRWEDKHGD